jgi:hypothetical protein
MVVGEGSRHGKVALGAIMGKLQMLTGVAALVVGAGFGFSLYHRLQPDEPGREPRDAKQPVQAPLPRLRMLQWDFGILAPGGMATHRLKITNPGPTPWRLMGVKPYPPCQCAAAKLLSKTGRLRLTAQAMAVAGLAWPGVVAPVVPQRTLALAVATYDATARSLVTVEPGETAWLEVTYRPTTGDGRKSGTIMVDFAYPGPVFQLMVQGEVQTLLAAEPPRLEFNYSPKAGTRLRAKVKLSNHSGRPAKITHVEAPDWIQYDAEPVGKAGKVWNVTVLANPGQLHAFSESAALVIHTDADGVGPVSIPVSLTPPLKAMDDRLDFGTVEPGQERRQKVILRAIPELGKLTEKDLVLTHELGPELDVQVQKKGANVFELLVYFRPKSSRGHMEAEIKIKTRKEGVLPTHVRIVANLVRLSGSGPRLRTLGTLTAGKETTQRFKITNNSTQPWKLKDISTKEVQGAEAKLPAKVVAPGQSVWLEITYRPPTRKGATVGRIRVEFVYPGPVFEVTVVGKASDAEPPHGEKPASPP